MRYKRKIRDEKAEMAKQGNFTKQGGLPLLFTMAI